MSEQTFARFWDTHHPGIAPLGYVLREARHERWPRVHSLPESKRLPDDEHDWATLLDRQRTLAAEVLGEGAPVWLVIAGTYLDERGALPVLPDLALAPALEMVVAHDALDDTEPWTFHVAEVRWDPAHFEPLLRAIANDELRALFARASDGRVLAPYDGGVDTILETPAERDRLRERFRFWLSRHPLGL